MTSQKFPGIEADGTVSASTTAGAIRTNLGLGTAALANTGTTNGTVPLLDATGLPAVDGSQLTNATGITAAGAVAASTDAATIRGNLAVGMVDGGAGEITTPAALHSAGQRAFSIDSNGDAVFVRRNVRNLSEWGVAEGAADNGARINAAIQEWYQLAQSGGAGTELWDFEIDPGQYSIEQPIVFGFQDGGEWQFGYSTPALRGGCNAKPASAAGPPFSSPLLIATFSDGPLIATQASRGLVLQNLQLRGSTSNVTASFGDWTQATFSGRANNVGSTDATYGQWSPSCLIAIDPFGEGPDEGVAAGPPTASRYQHTSIPDEYYTAENKYSSNIKILDCAMERSEVGILIGAGVDSNSDGIEIHGCSFYMMSYCISTCHAQCKNIYVDRSFALQCWVVFTGTTHGRGAGLPPTDAVIGNSSLIGCVYYGFLPQYGSVALRNSLVETVGAIYCNPTAESVVLGNAQPIELSNLNILLDDLPSFPFHIDTTRQLSARDCFFQKLSSGRIRFRNSAAADPPAVFDTAGAATGAHEQLYYNCVFDGQIPQLYGDQILGLFANTQARRDWFKFDHCSTNGSGDGTVGLHGRGNNLRVGDWRGPSFDCKNGGTGGHFFTTTNLQDSVVTEPWTIAVWLRPDTLSGDNVFIGGLTTHTIGIHSGNVLIHYGGSDTTEPGINKAGYGNVPLSAGSWQHFLISWDGTSIHFYHNGFEYLPTDPASGNNVLDTAVLWNIDLYFGVSAGPDFQAFDGLARNCIIWKGTDEKANVDAIMAGTYTTGAAIIWEMDDTSGTQVTDTSGNASHGTSNTDLSVPGSMYAVDHTTHFPEGLREYSKQLAVRSVLTDDASLAAGQSITEADSSGNILSKINIGGTVYKTTLHQASIPTYTIASGVITISPFDKLIKVETESAAATDDLNTISGGQIVQEITVIAATAAQDTVLKDGVDNLDLTGDITVTSNTPVKLINIDGTNWVQVK